MFGHLAKIYGVFRKTLDFKIILCYTNAITYKKKGALPYEERKRHKPRK